VVVGAPGSNQGTGRAYVFRGSPTALSLEPSAVLDGPNGKGALFGSVVTGVGDIDGDGHDDFVVTAPKITGLNPVGRVHVFRGGAGTLPSAPAFVLTGPDGGSFGGSLGCGDFDGDGFADLLVGTLGTPGRAYVFRGTPAGLTGTPNSLLVAPDGTSTTFGGAMARVSPLVLPPRTRRCDG
jgi:hypothetical protein